MKPAFQENPALEDIPPHVCGWLEVDLQRISQNFHILKNQAHSADCAAVVKANAYGLGLVPVSCQLFHEGCKQFFVAHLEEAITLRKALPEAVIYVLTGCLPQTEQIFLELKLIPVLNDFQMLERWVALGKNRAQKLPALLHVDTGMQRIGFDQADFNRLRVSMERLSGMNLKGIISHLACSPDPDHTQNERQRTLFEGICRDFPGVPRSLADTAGIYLGPAYHYDFVRPGKGLFGLFKSPNGPELEQAFRLKARIIQIRQTQKGDLVGYGGQAKLTRDSTLATLGLGYADGLDRRSNPGGFALIGDFKAPIVGSLSMDYTVIDITDTPPSLIHLGGWVQLTGPNQPLEDIAADFGTISRELSTRLGTRLYRSEYNWSERKL